MPTLAEAAVTLVRSPSGASMTCSACGTVYDLHGVDVEDLVPPVGDGCVECAPPTPQEIDEARTAAGGWTREQLAEWGVPWPPPRGWRRRLEARTDGDL